MSLLGPFCSLLSLVTPTCCRLNSYRDCVQASSPGVVGLVSEALRTEVSNSLNPEETLIIHWHLFWIQTLGMIGQTLHIITLYFSEAAAMTGVLKIEKWNEESDGKLTVPNMERKLQQQGFNCMKYEFSPGTVFPDHTHSVSKKDSIVTGQFEIRMYGQKVILQPGDMIDIPRNTVHNAQVIGDQTVTFFDASK